jgi:hypothetical protein
VREARRINGVHRTLSQPLTIIGTERKFFFFAMCLPLERDALNPDACQVFAAGAGDPENPEARLRGDAH